MAMTSVIAQYPALGFVAGAIAACGAVTITNPMEVSFTCRILLYICTYKIIYLTLSGSKNTNATPRRIK
jgi:uncharacterized protein (DUF2062 family)